MGTRYNLKFNCPEKPSAGNGFIYALFDPRNPKLVKYVGKTITPLRRRLAGHNCTNRMHNLELKEWVESLHIDGLFPSACVLETASVKNLKDREEHWIAFYKPLGLLNRSFGDGSRGLKGVFSESNRIATAKNFALSNKIKSKSVLCVETGEAFESLHAAERILKLGHGKIKKSIEMNTRIRGLKFEFLKKENNYV